MIGAVGEGGQEEGASRAASWWVAQAVILAAAAYYFWPVVRCLDGCFVDLRVLGSHPLTEIHASDMRLNAWILGWVQHAMLDPALSLFDSNTFHPARNALTGSEHMFGVALQMLPLRWFNPDAVALHQGAMAVSAVVLAWTSFATVRWATGSVWAAGVSAIAALFAPWRLTELPHLQLLSVQWIPLVWLLVTRIALSQGGARAAALLTLVLGVQLLSSFYLAYYTTLSIAVLVAAISLRRRIEGRALLVLIAAAVIPYAALAWFSLPYLVREAASELAGVHRFFDSSTLAWVWSAVAPRLQLSLGAPPGIVEYSVSAPVFVLALLAPAVFIARNAERRAIGDSGQDESRRLRVGALAGALWGIVFAACVMSLGRQIWIAGESWSLPGAWLSAWVPGFEVLRVPHRWLILVGVAAPILAGLGAWNLEQWLRRAAEQTRRAGLTATRAVVVARAVIVLSLFWTLSWQPLPVRAAMPGSERLAPALRALALLPAGPIVEIPWPMTVVDDIVLASRYTLSSTRHWRPTLNGFTAYLPPTYLLLQRVAQGLPDPAAVRRLRALSGLKFIVLHSNRLAPEQARAWRDIETSGLLQEVYADAEIRIFQIAEAEASEESGESRGLHGWAEALASPDPRSHTLAGVSREALALVAASGTFEVTLPRRLRSFANDRSLPFVAVSIENASDRTWPGLDVQREGLVELQYRFLRPASGSQLGSADLVPVLTATAALDVDMPAGKRTAARAYLKPPSEPGEYWLEVDLVQRLGDSLELLPLGVQRAEVRVTR